MSSNTDPEKDTATGRAPTVVEPLAENGKPEAAVAAAAAVKPAAKGAAEEDATKPAAVEKRVSNEEAKLSPAKRQRTDAAEAEEKTEDFIDRAVDSGLKAGDCLQVKREVETETKWLDCTLLPHDGRTFDGVALRTLKFEAQPPNDPETLDVLFFGHPDETLKILLCLSPIDDAVFRIRPKIHHKNEDETREMINSIVMEFMAQEGDKINKLDRFMQGNIAMCTFRFTERVVEALTAKYETGPVGAEELKEICEGLFKESCDGLGLSLGDLALP